MVGNHFKDNDSYFNGEVKGYASFLGDIAKININEDGLSCKMTMVKTNKGIEVKEDTSNPYGGCYDFRGVQVGFNGVYKKK